MTIRELAHLLNLSPACVSRILNNDNSFNVSEQTRNRVLDLAQQSGYDLSHLRKNKKTSVKKIACFMDAVFEKRNDSYYSTILKGIFSELLKHNYFGEVSFLNSLSNNKTKLSNEINSSEGIILLATPPNDLLSLIKKQTRNIVCVDTSLTSFDNIRYNRFEAGCNAMRFLMDNGHKKIAFIGSHIPYKFSLHFGRYDAYRTMMRRFHLPINDQWIIDCNWNRDLCFEMTKSLMQIDDRPTAIFFASDYMAIASVAAIMEEKLSVPDDISIVGISDIEEAKYLNPPLTTIRIPQYDMGMIAVNTLINRINGDKTPAKQIYVPTELIVRSTVKKLG